MITYSSDEPIEIGRYIRVPGDTSDDPENLLGYLVAVEDNDPANLLGYKKDMIFDKEVKDVKEIKTKVIEERPITKNVNIGGFLSINIEKNF